MLVLPHSTTLYQFVSTIDDRLISSFFYNFLLRLRLLLLWFQPDPYCIFLKRCAHVHQRRAMKFKLVFVDEGRFFFFLSGRRPAGLYEDFPGVL